jgi:hypothetical protein
MEELRFHWTDYYEILYLNIFSKICRKKFKFLQFDKNNGYFALRRTVHLSDYLPEFNLEWEMLQLQVVE